MPARKSRRDVVAPEIVPGVPVLLGDGSSALVCTAPYAMSQGPVVDLVRDGQVLRAVPILDLEIDLDEAVSLHAILQDLLDEAGY